jgi:hypothetical protein
MTRTLRENASGHIRRALFNCNDIAKCDVREADGSRCHHLFFSSCSPKVCVSWPQRDFDA